MRRKKLFLMTVLCVTLAFSGCRSNKMEDTGDVGIQNKSTVSKDTEEEFGLEKLQISRQREIMYIMYCIMMITVKWSDLTSAQGRLWKRIWKQECGVSAFMMEMFMP